MHFNQYYVIEQAKVDKIFSLIRGELIYRVMVDNMKEFTIYYKDKDNGSAEHPMTYKVKALTPLAATNFLDREKWLDSHSVQMYKVEEVNT